MARGFEVPQHLADSILRGRCIAFVGAGFSMPAVPSWKRLLELLGDRLGGIPPIGASALELEAAGQMLRDRTTERDWERHVKAVLDSYESPDEEDGRRRVALRRDRLRSIPFRAILTTNFDPWLPSGKVGPETYWQILREDASERWNFTFDTERPNAPVIKLHGDANGDPDNEPVVLGRADYRRRVYGDSRYTAFLRAAFAEYTVLFLGVSFTDAYLNELRSEVHNLLHRRGDVRDEPWGYAVLVGQPPHVHEFFRKHEGIEPLVADDFIGFDAWLEALEERTSIRGRLKHLLGQREVVWVDANPRNNARGHALLEACGVRVEQLVSETELADRHADAALLITHFGHEPETGDSRAFRVLARMRAWPTRPPVVVFASYNDHVADNRLACLRRGAWDYATSWGELYRLIELLFGRVR